MTLEVVKPASPTLEQLADVVSIKQHKRTSKIEFCNHDGNYTYDKQGFLYCDKCGDLVSGLTAVNQLISQWNRWRGRVKELQNEAIERIKSTGADRCPFCGDFFKQITLHGRHCKSNPDNKGGYYMYVKSEAKP